MLYQISNGSLYLGGNDIFEDVDFQVNENEKIALVGRNGSGKTSLLKVIVGENDLSRGEIHVANKTQIAYLEQNALINDALTAKEAFAKVFAKVLAKEKELEELTFELSQKHDDEAVLRFAKLQEEYENLGGYTYQSEMKTVFTGFGFKIEDLDRPLSSFSGGEKTKIAFARLLLSKPDLLLLDEPTNHLDLNTIEWLEGYLAKYKKAMILVSHDRTFLDRTCNVVYEMEYGKLKRYSGNYSSFVEQKKNDFDRQEAAYRRQQKEIKRLEELIEKFRYKKNKAAFAQSKIKYLERMDKVEDPKKADTKSFKAHFVSAVKGGKNVLSLDHLSCGYDHELCNVTLDILHGERVCVMGNNGCGKSTLLKTIVGDIKSLGGYMLFGHQIEVGYFDQNLAQMHSEKTVLEELWDEYPDLDKQVIRNTLGAFLFSSDEVFKTVSVLSGGEKVRLALAKLMLKGANFLILDEPTNHLDIISKEALEAALSDYDGTILMVSHDRYFIKKIATSCLVLENGKATYYPDGYGDYIDRKKSINKSENKDNRPKSSNFKPKAKYNLKKIEAELVRLEELLESKRALRFEPEYYHDHQKMQKLDEEIDDIHNLLHHEEEKWEAAMLEKENEEHR